MNQIKALRKRSGYTQKKMAEMLGTTQQNIARWETGAVEPSLSAVRDMAMIFGTSIESIMRSENTPVDIELGVSRLDFEEATDNMNHWGIVGITFENAPKTFWYPITKQQLTGIYNYLSEDETDWFNIITLNNRIVCVNSKLICDLKLCSDDADPLENENISAEEYIGYPIELYKVLSDKPYAEENGLDWSSNCSDKLLTVIDNFIDEYSLHDDDVLQQKLRHTTIYQRGHEPSCFWANDKQLSELIYYFSQRIVPRFLNIDSIDGQLENFYRESQVYMIEMPLIDVMQNFSKHRDNLHEITRNTSLKS